MLFYHFSKNSIEAIYRNQEMDSICLWVVLAWSCRGQLRKFLCSSDSLYCAVAELQYRGNPDIHIHSAACPAARCSSPISNVVGITTTTTKWAYLFILYLLMLLDYRLSRISPSYLYAPVGTIYPYF